MMLAVSLATFGSASNCAKLRMISASCCWRYSRTALRTAVGEWSCALATAVSRHNAPASIAHRFCFSMAVMIKQQVGNATPLTSSCPSSWLARPSSWEQLSALPQVQQHASQGALECLQLEPQALPGSAHLLRPLHSSACVHASWELDLPLLR